MTMNYQRQHPKDNYQSQAAEVLKDLLLHQKRKLKIYLEEILKTKTKMVALTLILSLSPKLTLNPQQ
jgi:hypothetical protein